MRPQGSLGIRLVADRHISGSLPHLSTCKPLIFDCPLPDGCRLSGHCPLPFASPNPFVFRPTHWHCSCPVTRCNGGSFPARGPQVCVPAACQVPRLRPHSGPNPRPGYRRQHRDLQPHPWRAHPALSPLRARDRDPERLPHPAPTTPPPGPTWRSGVPSPPASPDLWPASPAA